MPLSVIHYVFFFIRGEANVTFSQCKRAWVFAVGEGGCGTTRSGRRPDFFLFFFMRKNVAIPVWEMVAPLLFDWPKSMDAQRGSELAGNR